MSLRFLLPILLLLSAADVAGAGADADSAAVSGPDSLAAVASIPLEACQGKTLTGLVVEGNKHTRQSVITRELHLEIGKPVDTEKLLEDLVRLQDLGVFSSVGVSAVEEEGGVGLTVQVREVPPYVGFPAVSYSEQDGWSYGAFVASTNFLGRATTLGAGFSLGGLNTFALSFHDPWVAGNHLSLSLVAQHLQRDDPFQDFRETDTEFTPAIGTYIGSRGRAALSVSYLRVKSDVPGKTLSPDDSDVLPSVYGSIGYDSRDSQWYPHRGWFAETDLKQTGGFLGGDADYTTWNLDLRRYQPIRARSTLVVGGLLSLQSGTVGVSVPQYMQYYLGGANSIRGYDAIVLGNELYGKNQTILTAEFHQLLLPIREVKIIKWTIPMGLEGSLFGDWGTGWSTSDELDGQRDRAGVGVGLGWLLPGVQVLRAELGWGESGSVQFHFAAGFKLDAQRARFR